MRIAIAILTAVALTGLAAAGPAAEEAFKLDLSSLPGGMTLFLKCSRGHELTNCGIPSLWQQANAYSGLQSSHFHYGGQVRDPDARILV